MTTLSTILILGLHQAPGLAAPSSALPAFPSGDGPAYVSMQEVTPPDSSDLRKEARNAQYRFERRRNRLAHFTWGGNWGECDERVGRFCMRFSEGSWEPEPDVPELIEERERLIATLHRISTLIPGDPWVRGQLVWYLVEAGRPEEAGTVADRCPTTVGWWCPAFSGLAAHASGDYQHAAAQFDEALDLVEEEDAQRWTDIRDLMDRDGRRWLDRETKEGAGAEQAAERFWLLADPFYMIPGNERRTEHLSRWLVGRTRERARNGYGVSWGRDLAKLMVRYGWEIGWERTRPRVGLMDGSHMIGHQHPDAVQFSPPGDVLQDPVAVVPGAWVTESREPQATYAPAFATAVDSLPSLYARFPRGDSVFLVVAVDPSWGDTLEGPREEGVFAVSLEPGDPPTPEDARRASAEGTWALTIPSGKYVVSAEVVMRDADQGARARYGVDAAAAPPGVPVISDLLLLEMQGAKPVTLEGALATSGAMVRVTADSRVRAVWEVSGLGSRPEALSYSLELERLDAGFLRRAARALRIVGEDEAQLLTWTEAVGANERRIFRSLDLDLPDLDAGAYRLILTLRLAGRSDMVVERTFRVDENANSG